MKVQGAEQYQAQLDRAGAANQRFANQTNQLAGGGGWGTRPVRRPLPALQHRRHGPCRGRWRPDRQGHWHRRRIRGRDGAGDGVARRRRHRDGNHAGAIRGPEQGRRCGSAPTRRCPPPSRGWPSTCSPRAASPPTRSSAIWRTASPASGRRPVDLAQATGSDLQSSAESLVNTFSVFKDELGTLNQQTGLYEGGTLDAAKAADIYTAALNSSTTDLVDFNAGMRNLSSTMALQRSLVPGYRLGYLVLHELRLQGRRCRCLAGPRYLEPVQSNRKSIRRDDPARDLGLRRDRELRRFPGSDRPAPLGVGWPSTTRPATPPLA